MTDVGMPHDAEERRRRQASLRGDVPFPETEQTPYNTISDQRNQQYDPRWRDNGRGIENIQSTGRKGAGYATRGAGSITSRAGKYTERAGSAMTKAGMTKVGQQVQNQGVQMQQLGDVTKRVGSRVISNAKRGGHENLLPKTALAVGVRARAISTSVWSVSWASWLWLWVQAPFAVLSIIFLGLWVYVEYLRTVDWSSASWYEILLKAGLSVAEIFEWFVTWLIGIPPDAPAVLFFISWTIAIAVALIPLFLALFLFFIAGLRPLSGKRGGLKQATFLLALIGGILPLFQIFPWNLLFIAVVFLNPR